MATTSTDSLSILLSLRWFCDERSRPAILRNLGLLMIPTLSLPEFPFTKTTLANGLDVIVRRQGKLPVVAVNLWYHVGSKNEERRQRGFAHLFEHLMFEGSSHYSGDFFKPLQRQGRSDQRIDLSRPDELLRRRSQPHT